MVKGYGDWMVRSIQELRTLRGRKSFKPYAVGECWDCDCTIGEWFDDTNAWSDKSAGVFDFPLRWRLGELCDGYGFSLRSLADRGVLLWDRPGQVITFVENHDVVRYCLCSFFRSVGHCKYAGEHRLDSTILFSSL